MGKRQSDSRPASLCATVSDNFVSDVCYDIMLSETWHVFFCDVVSDNDMSGYLSDTVLCQKHSRKICAAWIQIAFRRTTNLTSRCLKPQQHRCAVVVSAIRMSGLLTDCGFYVRNLSDCTFFSTGVFFLWICLVCWLRG